LLRDCSRNTSLPADSNDIWGRFCSGVIRLSTHFSSSRRSDRSRDELLFTRVCQPARLAHHGDKPLTDYMLGAWRDHGRLDANRVGAFGFSAGGLTVLVAAGGEPDFRTLPDHCKAHPAFERLPRCRRIPISFGPTTRGSGRWSPRPPPALPSAACLRAVFFVCPACALS
jgi:hypothetical protein